MEFKNSPVQHDQKVFDYISNHLFIVCFHTYTVEVLNRSAHLFGEVIEDGLISDSTTLGKALAFVLDALKQYPY